MTTETRLAIALAAARPYESRWDHDAACKGAGGDRFFEASGKAQEESRGHCRECPVLDNCLTAVVKRESFSRDRWGVVGGLTPAQRIALAWEQRLRGHGPDLDVARMLMKPAWQYRLHPLRCSGLTPDEMAESLRIDGLVTDGMTVRLAVWWLGGKGAWVTWRTQDRRVERLVAEHADVMTRLRELGAIHAEVAAYLGVEFKYVTRAVTLMEQSRVAAEDLEVAA
ncbi:WhiB family transcriptional regulator [Streptomyces sp. NPDC021012]|uniref:WhiB family transcriptional regulator n=1 Tax=Streptomyces sp. NPDC021012 TaxID=3365107 RepID=UPI0037A9FA69